MAASVLSLQLNLFVPQLEKRPTLSEMLYDTKTVKYPHRFSANGARGPTGGGEAAEVERAGTWAWLRRSLWD